MDKVLHAAELAAKIATAKAYPFPRPDHSFVFVDGKALELASVGWDRLEDAQVVSRGRRILLGDLLMSLGLGPLAPMRRRTPVLAIGANGSPERLVHKFAHLMPGVVIPVLRAELHDFDVVYSCHFSSYGAIPATLALSPRAVTEVAVTYLDERELHRMHETELKFGHYAFGRLDRVRVVPEARGRLESVHSYWNQHGSLSVDGVSVALAQVRAEGRSFAAMTKLEVLTLARDRLAPGVELNAFIAEVVRDSGARLAHSLALRETAHAFDYPHATPLAP